MLFSKCRLTRNELEEDDEQVFEAPNVAGPGRPSWRCLAGGAGGLVGVAHGTDGGIGE